MASSNTCYFLLASLMVALSFSTLHTSVDARTLLSTAALAPDTDIPDTEGAALTPVSPVAGSPLGQQAAGAPSEGPSSSSSSSSSFPNMPKVSMPHMPKVSLPPMSEVMPSIPLLSTPAPAGAPAAATASP